MNGIELLKQLIAKGEELKGTFEEKGSGKMPTYTRTTNIQGVSQWIAEVNLWIENYTSLNPIDLVAAQFKRSYDKAGKLELAEFEILIGGLKALEGNYDLIESDPNDTGVLF